MSRMRSNEKARDAVPTHSPDEVNSNVPNWLAPFAIEQELDPLSRSRWAGVLSSFFPVVSLPIVYGGLVGLLLLGLWMQVTNDQDVLSLVLYGIGGGFALVFMIAPFIFAHKPSEFSYELSETEHGDLFRFVHAIADHVGADRPAAIKIDLDTDVRVRKGDDDRTVVTFGLPLIATCTLRQMAGFLGQRLHQCSRRPEVAYWSFVKMIHDLFARSAYKDGASEVVVPHWGGIERRKSSVSIGFVPWGFAKLAELFGAAIETKIELGADRCQAKISGSEEFAATHLDAHLLREVVEMSRKDLEAAKQDGVAIPDLPAFYADRVRALKANEPEKINQICQDLMTPAPDSTAGRSMAERVARIQQLNAPGVFHVDEPAANIFADFGALCCAVSKNHYETHFPGDLARHDVEEEAAGTPSIGTGIQLQPTDNANQPDAASLATAAETLAPPPDAASEAHSVENTNAESRAAQRRQQIADCDRDNDDPRDVLERFLQDSVLISHQEIFLPLQDLTPAKQPKRMVAMLGQARDRYLTLVREQKSDLHELELAIMHERALQLADTMSAAGLEIGATALGLSSGANRVVRQACKTHSRKLAACRKSVQELREQAVLRFVAVLQLADVPEMAQHFTHSRDEVESVRMAVKCLANIKLIWPKIRELAGQQRQLRCLWFNLTGNEHLEDLTTCINLSSRETMELLRDIHVELPKLACAAKAFGLDNFDFESLPDGIDGQALVTHSADVVDQLETLYQRCFTVIAELTEQIEESLGHPPLPVKADAFTVGV